MDRSGTPDRLGADLRKADLPDIALADDLGDRADRVLDRYDRVEPGRAVDVDVVGAKALKRIGEKGLHRRRPRVEADRSPPDRAERRT